MRFILCPEADLRLVNLNTILTFSEAFSNVYVKAIHAVSDSQIYINTNVCIQTRTHLWKKYSFVNNSNNIIVYSAPFKSFFCDVLQ